MQLQLLKLETQGKYPEFTLPLNKIRRVEVPFQGHDMMYPRFSYII